MLTRVQTPVPLIKGLIEGLINAVGRGSVRDDPAHLALMGHDV